MEFLTNEILVVTEPFYKIVPHSILHNTISLIISQKVSFNVGRSIRVKMFKLIGSTEFTKENISKFNNLDLQNIGLDQNKIQLIKYVVTLNVQNDTEFITLISKLKGIGNWTIKALKILNNVDNFDIFLSEDLWIRKRLSELLSKQKTLTIKECDAIILNSTLNKPQLTKFLWRIKPEGISALKNKQSLTYDHFI